MDRRGRKLRKVGRQGDLNPPQASYLRPQPAVDHFAPESIPHLSDAYFEARDRRRLKSQSQAVSNKVFRRISIIVGAICAGVGLFVVLNDGAPRYATPGSLQHDVEKAAIAAGFGIDQVSLSGHKFTLEDDIFDALDLPNTHSLLSFDPELLRERLQRLPWIKTATTARIFPGQLQITVTERQPVAVWRRGGQDYLIDDGGRVLAGVTPGIFSHLPRLRGEDAAPQIAGLFALLEQFPDVSAFVTASERVGERRWTLHLVGGGKVLLPTQKESQALQAFLKQKNALALIRAGDSIIDLRAEGRIAIRPAHTPNRVSGHARPLG